MKWNNKNTQKHCGSLMASCHLKKKNVVSFRLFLSTTPIHRCFGWKVEANQHNTRSEFSKYQKPSFSKYQSKYQHLMGQQKHKKSRSSNSFHLCHCPFGEIFCPSKHGLLFTESSQLMLITGSSHFVGLK